MPGRGKKPINNEFLPVNYWRDNSSLPGNNIEVVTKSVQEPDHKNKDTSKGKEVSTSNSDRAVERGRKPPSNTRPTTRKSMDNQKSQIEHQPQPRVERKDEVSHKTIKLNIELENHIIYEYTINFYPTVDSYDEKVKLVESFTKKNNLATYHFYGSKLILTNALKDKYNELEKNETIIKVRYHRRTFLADNMDLINFIFINCMKHFMLKLTKEDDTFDPKDILMEPSKRMHVWPGKIFRVDEEKENFLKLTLDVSSFCLKSLTIYDILEMFAMSFSNIDVLIVEFKKFIVGKLVKTPHNNRLYKVVDVDYHKSPATKFLNDGLDGKITTYKDYYRIKYGLVLKNLDQPLLCVELIQKDGVKKQIYGDKVIHLIPEFAILEYCVQEEKIPLFKEKKLILKSYIENVEDSPDALKLFQEWGLTLKDYYV